MTMVAVTEGYRMWAPTYSEETAISSLENDAVKALTPTLAGRRLLDAGCGTGRRLRSAGAAIAIGVEPVPEMVAAGVAVDGPLRDVEIVTGDVRHIPMPSRAFDVVWCRLVLGHLPSIGEAYAELARVADCGATVVVSDFHAAAVEAGHRRSFRAGAKVIELEHYVHRAEDHIEAASVAGLVFRDMRESAIGPDVRSFYERAGKIGEYARHAGLPVVLTLSFRRER
jgi:malonyl-CoA O-methyltransferase